MTCPPILWFHPLLPIPVAARRLVAVLAVQPQTTPQFGILSLQADIFGLQARHLGPQTGNFAFQGGQSLKQDIYFQLWLGHGGILAHSPRMSR